MKWIALPNGGFLNLERVVYVQHVDEGLAVFTCDFELTVTDEEEVEFIADALIHLALGDDAAAQIERDKTEASL